MRDIARTGREAARKDLDNCGEDQKMRLSQTWVLNALGKEFLSVIHPFNKGCQRIAMGATNIETMQQSVKAELSDSVVHKS